MLTQCPNCQTIFRVTSEILRVADGQVRCGRCQRQFDALARLIEENADEDAAAEANAAAAKAPENFEVEEPISHEDITMEGRHIEISGTYRVPDRYGNGSELQKETTEEWVEIGDADDEDAFEDRPATGKADAEQLSDANEDANADSFAASVRKLDEVEPDTSRRTTSARTTGSPRFAQRQANRAAAQSAEAEADILDLRRPGGASPKIWRYLVAPLLVLLIVQWVHSYRAVLARHPTVGEPLQAIYKTIGIPLTPNWNLHAYQIRQWGVISDPSTPGTLKVRASVTNLADFAQPYPLLKLVLEDRWGDQIRAREFQPSEYLEPTVAANRLLSPGQQANATIAIVDPGPDAEGFRFDVCLQGSAGTVCAEEVRPR